MFLEGKYLEGTKLVAIGYGYGSKVILYFIIQNNAGSARKGKLCEIKFIDSHDNGHARLVDRSSVILYFFEFSNYADKYD